MADDEIQSLASELTSMVLSLPLAKDCKYEGSVLKGNDYETSQRRILLLLQAPPVDAIKGMPFHFEYKSKSRKGEIGPVKTFRKLHRLISHAHLPIHQVVVADAYSHMIWTPEGNVTNDDVAEAEKRVQKLVDEYKPTTIVAFGEHAKNSLSDLDDKLLKIYAPHPSKFEMHRDSRQVMALSMWRLQQLVAHPASTSLPEGQPDNLSDMANKLASSNHVQPSSIMEKGQTYRTSELFGSLTQFAHDEATDDYFIPSYSSFCANYLPYPSSSSPTKKDGSAKKAKLHKLYWKGLVVYDEVTKRWSLATPTA